MLTLEQLKDFLRIDSTFTEEDSFLSSLLLSTEKFIKNATAPEADTNSELFQLAQRLLSAHWYENRGLTGKSEQLPFHLESILLQIAYAEGLDTTDVQVIDSGEF